VGGLHGLVIGLGAAQMAAYVTALRSAGVKGVDDLVTEAMLHPEIARILMAKVTPETTGRIVRGLQHAVTRAAAADFGIQAKDEGYGPDDSPPVPSAAYAGPRNALSMAASPNAYPASMMYYQ
jgi:hypothetical protein